MRHPALVASGGVWAFVEPDRVQGRRGADALGGGEQRGACADADVVAGGRGGDSTISRAVWNCSTVMLERPMLRMRA